MAESEHEVGFSVDTHLFRELGELLVGRDATALLELVKNAYDADAEQVIVRAERLADTSEGSISIVDDGHGMRRQDFLLGFLRIASRVKDTGDRRSALRKRRFTGAKGVGRLAAHKLARVLKVDSIPAKSLTNGRRQRIVATIDWDLIESVQTLDAIPAGAVKLAEQPVPYGASAGTTITLTRLRKAWTSSDRARFVAEVSGFEPLRVLTEPLPRAYLAGSGLFDRPRIRDAKGGHQADSFHLKLDGDFGELSEVNERALLTYVPWIVEVQVDGPRGVKRLAVIPTSHADEDERKQGVLRQELPLDESEGLLTYDVRILIRPGAIPKQLSGWERRIHGVRVFMEGFRVLPYGEPGDDWLEFDRAVTERMRRPKDDEIAALAESIFSNVGEDVGLSLLPNKHYYGGVFLTSAGSPSLQMLVNREGFVPGASFESIRRCIRTAVWLATFHIQAGRQAKRTSSSRLPKASTFASETRDLESLVKELRGLARPETVGALRGKLDRAELYVKDVRSMGQAIVEEAALLRDTAAVGLQLARFVHELNGLLGTVIAIEEALNNLKASPGLTRAAKSSTRKIQDAVAGLRKSFERYANYFGGLLSNTARRRRSVQTLRDRLDETLQIVDPVLQERQLEVEVNVSEDLRVAPIFAAELRTLFLNLLTNAIKAAQVGGKIRIAAKRVREQQRVEVVIENTGTRVDLSNPDKWFKPFKTTTDNPDPILGQGMGLGLPIVRMIVHEYEGTVAFKVPSKGYSTAVAFSLPLKP